MQTLCFGEDTTKRRALCLEVLLTSKLGTNLSLSENRLQTVFLLKDRFIPTLEKI